MRRVLGSHGWDPPIDVKDAESMLYYARARYGLSLTLVWRPVSEVDGDVAEAQFSLVRLRVRLGDVHIIRRGVRRRWLAELPLQDAVALAGWLGYGCAFEESGRHTVSRVIASSIQRQRRRAQRWGSQMRRWQKL